MLHFLVFVVVLSTNGPVGKQSCRHTVLSANCSVGELSRRATALPANCPVSELSCRRTVFSFSVNCPVGELCGGELSVGELSVEEVSVYPRFPRWYDCTKSDTVCVTYVFTSLGDVLHTQTKFASFSNCQKRRLVLSYYKTNL